jgi:hypothetical protein
MWLRNDRSEIEDNWGSIEKAAQDGRLSETGT